MSVPKKETPAADKSTRRFLSWGAVSFVEAPSSGVLWISMASLFLALAFCFAASFFIQVDVSVRTQGRIERVPGQLWVAEVFIPSQNISKVKKGYHADVSIDGYPTYKYGSFQGRIIALDVARFQSSGPHPMGFVAKIALDTSEQDRRIASTSAGESHDGDDGIDLLDGMGVEARVISRRASLISLAIDKVFGKDR